VFFTPLDWQLLCDCPVPVHLVTTLLNARPRNVLAIIDVLRDEGQDRVFNDQFIVMGTVQRKGLNKLLGTTAERLLHRAPYSVLAIKPGRMLQS
jgi:hypothetical protein